MSNTVTIGGNITLVSNQLRSTVSLIDTLNTTSSNYVSNNQNIATGSWQLVDQGSNPNMRYFFGSNLNTTSSIKIAIGSTATASYSAYLNPGDVAIIPNQAGNNVPIFAYAVGASSPAILQYLVSPA